ncbi:hypothetical protein O3M35_008420 [Rhynocoris fuscipes]|uniref:Uncharacterized protein n=1 Tax=Rhynocoris fuscipes TaxID=488301 RepID=A0AAW1D682_9HEMI
MSVKETLLLKTRMDDELFLRDLWQPSTQDSFLYNRDEKGAELKSKVMCNLLEMMSAAPCPKDSENSSNLYKILVQKLRGQISSYDSNPEAVEVTTRKVAKWVEGIVKEAYYRRQGKIKPRVKEAKEKEEEIEYETVEEQQVNYAPKVETISIRTVKTEPERESLTMRIEPQNTILRTVEIEPERASVRTMRVEPEMVSLRSAVTEPERGSVRTMKVDPEIVSLRSAVREPERGSVSSKRTEQDKRSITSGESSAKRSAPKSVVIDGVEYVLKEEKGEKKEAEKDEAMNFGMKVHKKLTKPVIRESIQEKIIGEQQFAKEYSVSESDQIPVSRFVAGRDERSVLVKAKRNARDSTVEGKSSLPPKKEIKNITKPNISEVASVSKNVTETSIDTEQSATPLIRSWSSWMINLTKKAKSLIRWDASAIDQLSDKSVGLKLDDERVHEQLKRIAKTPTEFLQKSLERADLNKTKDQPNARKMKYYSDSSTPMETASSDPSIP